MVRAGLSRERVRSAALAVADAEGLPAVTMRRVGLELGVEAMSLYRHVRDKADLLDAVHEAVLSEIAMPHHRGGASWDASIRALARAFRSALLNHPRCAPLFATRPAVTTESMAHLESGLSLLRAAGLSPRDALYAFQVLVAFVVGQVLMQVGPDMAEDDSTAHVAYESLPVESFPTVRATAPLLAGYDFDAEFDFGLRALVSGITSQAARQRR